MYPAADRASPASPANLTLVVDIDVADDDALVVDIDVADDDVVPVDLTRAVASRASPIDLCVNVAPVTDPASPSLPVNLTLVVDVDAVLDVGGGVA